jgi:hypothetical protein
MKRFVIWVFTPNPMLWYTISMWGLFIFGSIGVIALIVLLILKLIA